MEKNKTCEKCGIKETKYKPLYTSLVTGGTKCFNCGGRKQCEYIEEGKRCIKGVYNNELYCAGHGGCPKCVFIFKSLITGPKQCETNACRKGKLCKRHSLEKNRDIDEKLLEKKTKTEKKIKQSLMPINSKFKKNEEERKAKKELMQIKRTVSESKTTEEEPKAKRQKITSVPAPVLKTITGEDSIYEGEIYAEGIAEEDTSFTGENKYDTTYGEKEGKELKQKHDILSFFSGIFKSPKKPKKPSDGKRKKSIKSRRKSRRKSRGKSSRRNKKYIYKSLKSSYKK